MYVLLLLISFYFSSVRYSPTSSKDVINMELKLSLIILEINLILEVSQRN